MFTKIERFNPSVSMIKEDEFNRPTRKVLIPELDQHPLNVQMIRERALAKLTDEEKKVLGLDDNL